IVSDPNKLLDSFKVHLTESGGIRRSSISELVSLMANTGGLLAPKCISLCVIAASEAAVQSLLCDTEAWDILLKWLQEASQEEDFSFLAELMQLYLHLPVTFQLLTRNVCPKMIKTLSRKSTNEKVRSIAVDIVKKWMDVVSNANGEIKPRKRKLESVKKEKLDAKKEELSVTASSQPIQEVKKRRKTVKVPPTVMRTAGIEDAPELAIPKSRSEVLAKKMKNENPNEEPAAPIESFHQSITVTPTEPKKSPTEIHESFNFINALAHSQPAIRKKRKIPKLEPSTSHADINATMDDGKTGTQDFMPADPSESDGPSKSAITNFPILTGDRKANKKRVTWAPEHSLTQISYFEVDENERVNITRTIEEIRQQEHSLERQLFKRHEDVEMCGGRWYPPPPLEVNPPAEPGSRSTERETQLERERHILQTIYFTRESIPFTPEEPDKEDFVKKEPIQIPIRDYNDQLLVTKSTEDGSSKVSLNPNVADLVKSLALNFDQQETSAAANKPQSQPTSATSPPVDYKPQNQPNYPSHEHFEDHTPPMHQPPNMGGPPRMPPTGPPFMSAGERPHPGMRTRGPPMRPQMGPPFRHPQYPPDGLSQRFPRGGGSMPRPPYRGGPPPMFNGGRLGPMNPPPMRPRGPPGVRPEQICKFFQQGNCRNGSNCHFLHPSYQPPPPNW
ncbi:unnamed protein product, partial [Hymenolepis diminuta]